MLDKIFGKKQSGCCCGTRIVSLRQVNVGGRSIGITGLDETFQEYFKNGKTPVDSTGSELVEDLKKLNFIAEGAEEMYKKAFLIATDFENLCIPRIGVQKRCTRRPS